MRRSPGRRAKAVQATISSSLFRRAHKKQKTDTCQTCPNRTFMDLAAPPKRRRWGSTPPKGWERRHHHATGGGGEDGTLPKEGRKSSTTQSGGFFRVSLCGLWCSVVLPSSLPPLGGGPFSPERPTPWPNLKAYTCRLPSLDV